MKIILFFYFIFFILNILCFYNINCLTNCLNNENIIVIDNLPNDILLNILQYCVYQDLEENKSDLEILKKFKEINNNIFKIALINNRFKFLSDKLKKFILDSLSKELIERLLPSFIKNKYTINFAKYLISKNNNINLNRLYDDFFSQNKTLLMIASEDRILELVKMLLDKKVDVNKQDSSGYTALMYASLSGSLPIVKLLIENGVDVNKQNYLGDSALMWPALSGNIEIIEYLVENGINFEHQNYFGWTALICAAYTGKKNVVNYLLKLTNK